MVIIVDLSKFQNLDPLKLLEFRQYIFDDGYVSASDKLHDFLLSYRHQCRTLSADFAFEFDVRVFDDNKVLTNTFYGAIQGRRTL